MAYYMVYHIDPPGGPCVIKWLDEPAEMQCLRLGWKSPIDLARLPSVGRVDDRRGVGKRYLRPDGLLDIHGGAQAVVSQRFKDLVERFEPGVHFFKPVQLQMPSGEPYDGQHYIFTPRQAADFLLTEMTGVTWSPHSDDPADIRNYGPPTLNSGYPLGWHTFMKNPKTHPKALARKVYISAPAVRDLHIYTSLRGGIGNGVFFSDAFFDAFTREKMRYLQCDAYCTEVEVPWDEEENFGPALEWLRQHPARNEVQKREWARLWLERTPEY